MRVLRPLAPLLLAAGLAGCSGTPFGDQLSRSFSQPPAGAPAPTNATKPAAEAAKQPAAKPAASNPEPEPAKKPAAPLAPLTPAPYRVTIKLPAADPSSPAEAVTDALREAGVAFEVETIERVPANAEPAAPVRSPAPPAR
jgi:predicted lipid-binding transport protein (Tim44 family)